MRRVYAYGRIYAADRLSCAGDVCGVLAPPRRCRVGSDLYGLERHAGVCRLARKVIFARRPYRTRPTRRKWRAAVAKAPIVPIPQSEAVELTARDPPAAAPAVVRISRPESLLGVAGISRA